MVSAFVQMQRLCRNLNRPHPLPLPAMRGGDERIPERRAGSTPPSLRTSLTPAPIGSGDKFRFGEIAGGTAACNLSKILLPLPGGKGAGGWAANGDQT